MFTLLKRLFVGRPLASDQQDHQRIPKVIALAVFSSDAISSTAYATEEILFVTALGVSSLVLGLNVLVPIAIAVAILLVIVVASYRRTIQAYPQGGGSYIVSRENLPGKYPSLVAGASILVDYTLTVPVSISAGVAAIISIPRFRDLADNRVTLALVLVVLLALANLRGLKEAGTAFAFPTYVYMLVLGALIGYGLYRASSARSIRSRSMRRRSTALAAPAGPSGSSSSSRGSRPVPSRSPVSRRSRSACPRFESRHQRTRRSPSCGWPSSSARCSSVRPCWRSTSSPTRATTKPSSPNSVAPSLRIRRRTSSCSSPPPAS